jgi:superfamily II DNA/RNA helicase
MLGYLVVAEQHTDALGGPCSAIVRVDVATARRVVVDGQHVAIPRHLQEHDMSPTLTPRAETAAETFESLGVPAPMIRALERSSITTPTSIQIATIPSGLAGRDVLGQGQTGTGKTLAFVIPTLAALAASPRRARPGRPRALVLVPTRELATQVANAFTPLADAVSLRSVTVFGGVSQARQVAALRAGVDVVIACPGRLEDLVQQGHCSLTDIAVTVLDEADHLSDLGFLPAVKRLLAATPEQSQRLLFSATLDDTIKALVQRFLRSPDVHRVEPDLASAGTTAHHLVVVEPSTKFEVVRELSASADRTLMFTRTKHGAKKLTRQLCAAGVSALELHGNLSQHVRQRNLDAFARGSARVLVATDVAARGVHVDHVDVVIHVDVPAEHKTYVHRSGRTARAGASGVVFTLATPDQERAARQLGKAAGISFETSRAASGGRSSSPSPAQTRPAVPAKPMVAGQARQPRNRRRHRAGGSRQPARG